MDRKNTINFTPLFRKLFKVLITILTCLLVFKILYNNSLAFTKLLNFETKHVISTLGIFFILLIISFGPFIFIFKNIYKSPVSFFQLIPVLTIGRMANILAPQSGTLFKAVAFKSEFNLSYTQYINVFALFSWLTLLVNFLLADLLILTVLPELKLFKFLALHIVTGLFVVLLIGPVLFHYILSALRFNNILALKFHAKLKGIFEAIAIHSKEKKLLTKVVFFSILTFALNVLLFKMIFVGMDIPIGYGHIALLTIVRKISNLFFLTPGNVGIQELLYGAICESLGIGTVNGIMASVILRVVGFTIIFPIGIAFAGFRMFKK